jgi:lysophospholipase L1-like esterase
MANKPFPFDVCKDCCNTSGGGTVSPEDIKEAVNEYLEENPVESTLIDETLTKQGEAADAKVTGDALNLKADIGLFSFVDGNRYVHGFAAGAYSIADTNSVTIGEHAATIEYGSVAIGCGAESTAQGGVAIGYEADVEADNAIQLGTGTNENPNTFQVFSYQLLDEEGHIPDERFPQLGDKADVKYVDEAIQSIVGDAQGKDLIPEQSVENKILSYVGNKVVLYDNTNYSTVYVPISEGVTYILSASPKIISPAFVQVRYAVAYTDKSFDNSSYVSANLYQGDVATYVAQHDGYFVITTAIKDYGDVLFSAQVKSLKNDIYLSDEAIKEIIPPPSAKGSKLCVIGDSITYGYTMTLTDGELVGSRVTKKWHKYVAERYGIENVVESAEIGRAFTRDGSMSTRFTEVVKNIDADCDVIIVFGGTNDFGFNANIGNIDDEPSDTNQNSSFYSAVSYVANYLTNNFPNAEIIFMTPIPRNDGDTFNPSNTAGAKVTDYANAIAEVGRSYGIRVIDLNRVSNFYIANQTWIDENMPDGLHPNDNGTNIYVTNGIFPVLDEVFKK